MKSKKYQTSSYDSSLHVDTSSTSKVVLSLASKDDALKMSVTLDPESVKNLISELEGWSSNHGDVEYVSANQKFSWFNFRSED